MSKPITIWVSPEGNDRNPGTKAKPVKTPQRATSLLRSKRGATKKPTAGRILLREGTYFLSRPWTLDHRDSGDPGLDRKGCPESERLPTVIGGAPGETATLSGGKRITSFKSTQVNGVDAWVASIPAVRRGTWNFTQLWVNGERAQRPRLPEQGTYRIARRLPPRSPGDKKEVREIFQGDDRFQFSEGEVRTFHNLSDVEFVALHFWIESRIPLESVDEKKRTANLAYRTRMNLTDNQTDTPAPYYLDNVFEALTKPGQWYLDRPAGKLYYIPRPGESIDAAEVIAPVLDHVIRIEGDHGKGKPVECVELRDLTIAHSEHVPAEDARRATPQAACHVTGAVQWHFARGCVMRHCTVEHVGSYGIEFATGSSDCLVSHCHIHDLAAGGLRIFQTSLDPNATGAARYRGQGPWLHCRRIDVEDCHIHDGGHRWRQAVGILIGNCSGNRVVHNHIHDLDYTGVSVGWTWGYHESNTSGNIVEWNHIHDIGRGVLSDMGGIYTLGKQPGTRLRFNHIHHVDSRGYGGWGIYPDEGSTHILIENNLVHDTKCAGFHQHFGRDNVVRNNIFAFGREDCCAISRHEPHTSIIFEHNIIVADQPIMWRAGYRSDIALIATIDHNIYCCTTGERLKFHDESLTDWRKRGFDRHSLNKDPGFHNAAKRDFRLKANSPALKLGFVPFDLRDVGPRT